MLLANIMLNEFDNNFVRCADDYTIIVRSEMFTNKVIKLIEALCTKIYLIVCSIFDEEYRVDVFINLRKRE